MSRLGYELITLVSETPDARIYEETERKEMRNDDDDDDDEG